MTTATTEKEAFISLLDDLDADNAEKVLSYAAYLRHVQALENAEDVAAYFERKDEPSYSLEEVKRELGHI